MPLEPFLISLCRIVGNSLPPRHAPGQKIASMRFILENEPSFGPHVRRWWILNRIVDPEELGRLTDLLKEFSESYAIIPFNEDGFRRAFLDPSGMPRPMIDSYENAERTRPDLSPLALEWIMRHKSQALVNINFARNFALDCGRREALWTLPIDGDVTFTREGMEGFQSKVRTHPGSRFALLPMLRIDDFAAYHELDRASRDPEPQIAFHHLTRDRFDERLRYGHRNKAEMLLRIGVPGPWEAWNSAPWDEASPVESPDKGAFIDAGEVVRLPSGAAPRVLESSASMWVSRFEGVCGLARALDLSIAIRRMARETHWYAHDPKRIVENKAPISAACARVIGSFASPLLNDTGAAPARADMRFPDVSALTRHASVLVVGGQVCADKSYFEHAAQLVRIGFIHAASRIHPSVQSEPTRLTRQKLQTSSLKRYRDLWLLPQVLEGLSRAGFLSTEESEAAKGWCNDFLEIGLATGGVQAVLRGQDSRATWSSLVVTSLALHVGRIDIAVQASRNAPFMICRQFAIEGAQHWALRTRKPLRAALENLAGWVAFSCVAKRVGIDLLAYEGSNGVSLHKGLEFVACHRATFSDYPFESAAFDRCISALSQTIDRGKAEGHLDGCAPSDVSFGLPPFWPHLAPLVK